MDLEFITKLTEEEWVALINFAIQHYQKKEEKQSLHPVQTVKVHAEKDRKDLKGNRYAYLSTSNGPLSLSNYRVTDFLMSTEDVGMFGSYPPILLNEELRIFLTTRFGEAYLKALADYHTKQMEEELNYLSQYASLAKEKSK